LMARLPMEEIDLLIVDELGKEISGAGMDPNVTGRDSSGYSDSLCPEKKLAPHVFRIIVRDLSAGTKGNATGLGLADFTTSRAVQALDKGVTYMNGLTSMKVLPSKIPMYFDSDRETIEAALSTLASLHPEKLRVMRIANTLNLERLLVSESCIDELAGRAGVTMAGTAQPMAFDENGNLPPL